MFHITVDGQSLDLDLIATEETFVALEKKCNVTGSHPTTLLLDAVVQWLDSLGVPGCTRSAAWQVWWAVYERIDHLRKATQLNAELAYWFHVDPFGMTDEQRLGLIANLPRMKAQSTLHNGKFNGADYNYVYHLTLLATGDKSQAQRARADALERYVDSKIESK